MNIRKNLSLLYHYLLNWRYNCFFACNKKPVAFLLGVPSHSNLGDQAQSYCTELWLQRNYPTYAFRQFTTNDLDFSDYALLKKIAKSIKPEDIVLFQSGYNTSDLYIREERMHRKAHELLTSNQIIVFPQTVNFLDYKEAYNTELEYKNARHSLFLARDKVSFERAKIICGNVSVLLFPDIVTTLIGSIEKPVETSGIMLCVRNDRESAINIETRNHIIKSLSEIDNVTVSDTNSKDHYRKVQKNRRKYISEIIARFSKYKVVVTDRYHGMIFSLVAQTPVIVLNTFDHKLSSGVEWFTDVDEYLDYIYQCQSISTLPGLVSEVLSVENRQKLSYHFKTDYYDKLKEIIERSI